LLYCIGVEESLGRFGSALKLQVHRIMMTPKHQDVAQLAESGFLGLAPFLRMSIAGIDFLPLAQEMLAKAGDAPNNANLWMNLSTAVLCLGQREVGLAIQAQALEIQRAYHLAASQQPAKLRVLVLAVPGDLSANAPLDCLLENSDIDLDFHYLSIGVPLAPDIPEHDALFVAISASDESNDTLLGLEQILAQWPKPVINTPAQVLTTERAAASILLQDAHGVLIFAANRISRSILEDVGMRSTRLPELFAACDFPVIVRPVGSHGGRGLEKLNAPEEIAAYLEREPAEDFFVSQFIDYSGADGQFRKIRIMLIDGEPYACHMAVSSHWMVHYVNADMYEDAQKRAEEAFFLEHFEDFVQRHRNALTAIAERTGLDYLGIDCAETADGKLLVFEIDHAMVVHAMDLEDLFPHKQHHMQKVKTAFRQMLLNRVSAPAPKTLATE